MRQLFLLSLLLLVSGCTDIEIPSEDPFFKVGHTYETFGEHILIYRIGARIWNDYNKRGMLEPIPAESEQEQDIK